MQLLDIVNISLQPDTVDIHATFFSVVCRTETFKTVQIMLTNRPLGSCNGCSAELLRLVVPTHYREDPLFRALRANITAGLKEEANYLLT